jgi:ABC-2 type transport system ATP-binding protein
MTADFALELRGVTKHYRRFALADVSFSVPRGYVCGLIGPNGAGKTTIIKLIMNLVRRDGGEIRVFGLDNRRDEVAVKSRVGFVYDSPGFWDDRTLERQRRVLGPFYPGWNDRTFDRLAGEFELPMRQTFGKLSRGTKMKFALAMALAHDADLLILDEPTAGLDPVFRREFLRRLSGLLQDERKSVLFSTHITSDLDHIADYVTFVNRGAVAFSLPRTELLDTWGVVRGDEPAVRGLDPAIVRGRRSGRFGTEVLVSDARAAARTAGPAAVIDRPSLDDVMVLMAGESDHAS